jgi:hypothetical protein
MGEVDLDQPARLWAGRRLIWRQGSSRRREKSGRGEAHGRGHIGQTMARQVVDLWSAREINKAQFPHT